MKSIREKIQMSALVLTLPLCCSYSLAATGESINLENDGDGAKMTRFENLNDYRYCEIFMIKKNPDSGDLYGIFYNTTDRNRGAETRDSCPDDLWSKVDIEENARKYDLLKVFKNGPRYWLYDWLDLPVGAERNFDGLDARWFGVVNLPKEFGKAGATFYKTTEVHRKSKQGYKKGQTVFLLDDPHGGVWIMQAYSRIVDSSLSYEDLATLATKLKLPEGWKYRNKVLEEDLGVGAINGIARVTQDNLENTYNQCFEADGQKNCTYLP
jgi:hypothetical protein